MLVDLGLVEQRYKAVLEVLNDGVPIVEVAARVGVTRQSVHRWLKLYAARGLAPPAPVRPKKQWPVVYEPPASGRARAAADTFLAFARGVDDSALPAFAEEVEVVLGPEASHVFPVSDPTDRRAWATPERPDVFFRGGSGSFDPLKAIAEGGDVSVTVGTHPTCALMDFIEPDGDLDDLLQVSLRDIEGDSCVQWYAVDLMLDASFRIEAVILDRYEP